MPRPTGRKRRNLQGSDGNEIHDQGIHGATITLYAFFDRFSVRLLPFRGRRVGVARCADRVYCPPDVGCRVRTRHGLRRSAVLAPAREMAGLTVS